MDKLITNNKREFGASLIEYALLVALIAVVSMAAVGTVGESIKRLTCDNAAALDGGQAGVDGGCPVQGATG